MGNIIAIIVGIISFIVPLIGGRGSLFVAIIFGAVMYAMTYGAFVWRPGGKANKVVADGITPAQIGEALGSSLVAGHNPNEMTELELGFVQAANIPLPTYVSERFVLNACAAAFVINSSVPSRYKEEVRIGLIRSLEQTAASFPSFSKCVSRFYDLYPVYCEAGERDANSVVEPGVINISKIVGVFGDTLVIHTSGDDSANGLCRMLAMSVADAFWAARVRGSIMLMEYACPLLQVDA